jgi:ABC-2 type transport system ATP-binding protein
MSFVTVHELCVKYGPLTAVKDLSMAIPRGEVLGLIGPNGAGKTSTIKVLATLIRPARGWASIDGIKVHENPQAVRRKIGYMPDFFGVYDDLTVEQYLHFFAAAYRLDRSRRKAVVGDVLELTDLSEKRRSSVDSLSRGMKQRLGLARVLIHDPELLLLDEPASGLDPRARIEIRELLKELTRMGKTILISSHILHELGQLCSRICIIEAGRLVTEGPVQELFKKLELLPLVHVQITNRTEALLARIREIPGVASLEPATDRLVIQFHEDQITAEDLLDRLHDLGARIRMFQPEAVDMETAFMKLTEGKVK